MNHFLIGLFFAGGCAWVAIAVALIVRHFQNRNNK